jgi:hypothetical protein
MYRSPTAAPSSSCRTARLCVYGKLSITVKLDFRPQRRDQITVARDEHVEREIREQERRRAAEGRLRYGSFVKGE